MFFKRSQRIISNESVGLLMIRLSDILNVINKAQSKDKQHLNERNKNRYTNLASSCVSVIMSVRS